MKDIFIALSPILPFAVTVALVMLVNQYSRNLLFTQRVVVWATEGTSKIKRMENMNFFNELRIQQLAKTEKLQPAKKNMLYGWRQGKALLKIQGIVKMQPGCFQKL